MPDVRLPKQQWPNNRPLLLQSREMYSSILEESVKTPTQLKIVLNKHLIDIFR